MDGARATSGTMRRRALAAGAGALALTALAGCGVIQRVLGEEPSRRDDEDGGDGGVRPHPARRIPKGTTHIRVEAGETVLLMLGNYNASVGDDWGPLPEPDPSIATARVGADPSTDPDLPPGSSFEWVLTVTGVAPGMTSTELVYCTRSRIEQGCDQSHGTLDPPVEPIALTITVV